MRHKPLLPGNTEQKEIELIVNLLGSPNDTIWPGYSKLPFAKSLNLPKQEYVKNQYCHPGNLSLFNSSYASLCCSYNNLKVEFPRATEQTLNLLSGLLTYNPKVRVTVRQALRHPYFIESPRPLDPSLLPTYPEIRNQMSEKEK
jgi:cyclin-dependent kinase 10